MIIPSGKIYGAQYFIGVTIDSASAPGYAESGTPPTNYNWCLPKYTTINIEKEDAYGWYNSISSIPVTKPGCAGTVFWSNLINLVDGDDYRINVQVSSYQPYCPGYYDDYNGACWVSWQENKTCNEVCSHYGSTPYLVSEDEMMNYQDYYFDCDIESFLMGEDCSPCEPYSTYNYYDLDDNSCGSSVNYYIEDDGSNPNVGYVRVCPCNFQWSGSVSFTFDPFTVDF